eukprot:COSAG05_NODE_2178_length_3433_cov_77.463707_2_plen_57_part_00
MLHPYTLTNYSCIHNYLVAFAIDLSMVQVNDTHVALVYERDNAAHLSLLYIPLAEL